MTGTTTAEMGRMKSTAVSGYSPHGVVSEGLSLIFPGCWFQFLTLGLACCEEHGCIRRIRIQKNDRVLGAQVHREGRNKKIDHVSGV